MKKLTSIFLALIATFAFAITPAQAAAKLTGVMPADTTENKTVPLDFTLSGVSWSNVLVTISVVEGGLTVDAAGSITASPGYTLTDNTSSAQSFRGSLSDVKKALSSGLKWYTPAAAGTYSLDFKLTVQEYVPGLTFNSGNGHYYLVPLTADEPTLLTAKAAFEAAANGDFKYAGLTGYVAEINDADENDFISNKSGGDNIWIGASTEYSILDPLVGTSFGDHVTSVGHWYWVHSKTNFATGADNTSNLAAVDGAYMSWADGEPNDSSGIEGCVVTNWNGDKGLWNDLPCDDPEWEESFIVEFEPSAGAGAAILKLVTKDLPAAGSLASTGSDYTVFALFGLVIAMAGAVAVRKAQR